jgi:hypothetical protein
VLGELGLGRKVLTISEQPQMDGLGESVGDLPRTSGVAERRDEACSIDGVLRSARLPQ